MIWTFYVKTMRGRKMVCIRADTWFDARAFVHARDFPGIETEKVKWWETPTCNPHVEIRWVGSDACRSGSRHLQFRERKGKRWSKWERT